MSDEEVAGLLSQIASSLPADMIAEQVEALTREVTPERVSKQAHDLVGKLPSPGTVADIVHGIGNAASEHLDRAANTRDDLGQIMDDFMAKTSQLISDSMEKDRKSKSTPKKKGGYKL